MTEEAEDDGNARHDGSAEVGGPFGVGKDSLEEWDEDGHADEAHDHGCAVDANAANPLREVVAVGAEDEPLVAQERDSDADDAGEEDGVHVAVASRPGEQPVQEGEDAVTEDSVEAADEQVAPELEELFVTG